VGEYLIFRLYGPLASWGEEAVGERRPTALSPTRSALLGLVAAALGLRRGDRPAQQALSRSLRFGVKVEPCGVAASDYHTVQTVKVPRGVSCRSRREQVLFSGRDLPTILSRRDYRCDAAYSVAAWQRAEAVYSLERLEEALKEPVFPLYLGRRACPLAWPLAPRRVQAADLLEAFLRAEDEGWRGLVMRLTDRPLAGASALLWEGEEGRGGVPAKERLYRRDEPLDSLRHTFAVRTLYSAPLASPEASTEGTQRNPRTEEGHVP
jgi:CRISPR system Cascade subunit CasD